MDPKNYKDTLNLPNTSFPMKANLPNREPERLKEWEATGLYEKMLKRNEGKAPYILHDGPPYANGNIHIGHALNKILKDIIVKYKSMTGNFSPYVPGWDCHGLPIEHQVDKKLGSKKRDINIADKRLLCRQYAEKFVDIQREEFKRLGVLGDWDNPYITMSFDYEGRIVREFLEFYSKGYAYLGKKPVHWCPSCVTALAEAEVEHADKTSPSVFVKFKINKEDASKKLGISGADLSMVIWTTTPWTLPANLALAVGENITYAYVTANDGSSVIVAANLVEVLKEKGVIGPNEVEVTIKGSVLVGLKAGHPFIERESKVIEARFVSTEDGTGIVHIAPGHGQDDYQAGLAHGLEVYAPVNDYGKFAGSGVEEIENQFVFKANDTIIEILKDKNALLLSEDLTHSYPHCWRCKKPVIFRATEQWFISMDHEGLREKSLHEVEKTTWIPEWGKERIYGMIEGRPDWCISRQRSWGVPIAVLKCSSCKELVRNDEANGKIVAEFTEHGADVWYTKEAGAFLPDGYKCTKCGYSEFEKETDILDVWFDSGVSYAATLIPERGFPDRGPNEPPADMYLEGSDQHRGWFQSSLLASVGTRGHAPYKTVLTHGYTVDGKGRKMSKSQGNVVAPQDVIKKTGADIIRLWVSAEDYRGDVRISNEIIARLTEAYRKIRNTTKYLLGNLQDFDGGDYSGDLLEIDRWAMSRLQHLIKNVNEAYGSFTFHEVYHRLHHFCIVEMSNFYLDILKDRLYTFRADSKERRAAQWVLNEILMAMTRLMAPVLSFTADEIWQHIENTPADSVFLTDMPVVDEKFVDDELEARWTKIQSVRDEVNKALELKRAEKFIGNSLEAKVTVYPLDNDDFLLLREYNESLPTIFIVSQAEVSDKGIRVVEEASNIAEAMKILEEQNKVADWMLDSYQGEKVWVQIEKAEGEKCARCWNRRLSVGSIAEAPDICERCSKAVA